MEEIRLRVPNKDYVITDSIVDGPGLRATVFVQGCPHHCPGCHNPQTHSFSDGKLVSINDIYKIIKLDKGISGVTFSGGEPFSQAPAFSELAKMLKMDGYSLAVYSGWTFEELSKNLLPGSLDLLKQIDILIDGRFRIEQRSLDISFRGSKNQRIIDVPASLEKKEAVWTKNPAWLIKEVASSGEYAPKNIKNFGA